MRFVHLSNQGTFETLIYVLIHMYTYTYKLIPHPDFKYNVRVSTGIKFVQPLSHEISNDLYIPFHTLNSLTKTLK